MNKVLLILSLLVQGLVSFPGPTGTVTGQIRSNDGQPLPGISVMVAAGGFRDGRARLVPLGISIPKTMGQTDASGNYRLENIPPGRYYILADPRGRTNGEVATLYPGVIRLEGAGKIEVKPDSETAGIDFSIVRTTLVKVRGHVFNAVTVGPSTIATVNLTSALLASFRTTVDATGTFEIAGVPSGDYVLWATENSGGAPNRWFATRPIHIGDREIDDVELVFRPPVFVKGRVVFEDGGTFTNPGMVPGITANIVEGTFGTGTNPLMDGTFQLGGRAGVIEGEYHLSVDHLPGDYYVKAMSFGAANLLQETLKLNGPTSEEVRITLAAGTHVAGKVLAENQQPAGNVRVFLVSQNSGGGDNQPVRAVQTDNAGAFDIRGIAPGKYTIFAIALLSGFDVDTDTTREYQNRGTAITVSSGSNLAVTLFLLR